MIVPVTDGDLEQTVIVPVTDCDLEQTVIVPVTDSDLEQRVKQVYGLVHTLHTLPAPATKKMGGHLMRDIKLY